MIEDIIFNEKHYLKVLRERHKIGLSSFNDIYPENGRIFNHELENKKIKNIENGEEYTIQSIHKHWYHGWYYMILVYILCETKSDLLKTEIIDGKSYSRSHAPIFWENISCINEVILESIAENRTKYILINEHKLCK